MRSLHLMRDERHGGCFKFIFCRLYLKSMHYSEEWRASSLFKNVKKITGPLYLEHNAT